MRNTLVPQAGQSPLVAGRPFFKVTCSGLVISRFSRHFRQYASMAYPLREMAIGTYGFSLFPSFMAVPCCLLTGQLGLVA
jgi:hypothetical protein